MWGTCRQRLRWRPRAILHLEARVQLLRESAVEGTSLLKTSSSAQCLLGRRTRFEKGSSSDVPQKRLSEKQKNKKIKNKIK